MTLTFFVTCALARSFALMTYVWLVCVYLEKSGEKNAFHGLRFIHAFFFSFVAFAFCEMKNKKSIKIMDSDLLIFDAIM